MRRAALLGLALGLLLAGAASGVRAEDDTQLPDVKGAEEFTAGGHAPLPDEAADSSDPFVLLDAAKVAIADGKLQQAADMLAAIPPGGAEPYVAQEVLFQRLLLTGAFLNASGALLQELEGAKFSASGYAGWLRQQQAGYAQQFSGLAGAYLDQTQQGLACDFVRFRLPVVTAEHLKDLGMYSDAQVLRAAVENWDEGKQGLGEGLMGTQARVALVLAAASFYDLAQASATIEGVAARLHAGVPLDPPTVLDWLAQTAVQPGTPSAALTAVQRRADGRLRLLLAVRPDTLLQARYDKRNGLAPAPAPAQPKAKGGRRKSNKRQRKPSG
jgi:hypothetical protein